MKKTHDLAALPHQKELCKIHPNKKGSAPDHLVRGRAFRVIIFLQ